MRRSSHIVIGTPGRILDLVNRKALDLRKLNTLILDEFDRMLDMGFVHDVKKNNTRDAKQKTYFVVFCNPK